MSSNSSIPAFYKNEIREDDIKKLKEIFGKMEKDRKAAGFLEPVDYEGLQLYDYPTIIKHPMDLGTCKTKLLNGDYKIFQELMDDLNLIWSNCRTYNQAGSEIVKCANDCDKKMRSLIEKQFKNSKPKAEGKAKDSKISDEDKNKLIDMIRQQSDESLTQIVKIILKANPDGIEDIDNDKLQIKVDLLTYKEFDLIKECIDKSQAENNTPNDAKIKSD